jgi:hypothetical protein
MRIETQIIRRVTRAMHCSECGVEAAAACDCGAPYVPAGVAAANAVAAHPEKSDRAIAAEIGVSDKTVGRARRTTADYSAVDTRVGLDGKARKRAAKKAIHAQPTPKPAKPDPRIISPKLAERVGRFAHDLILSERLLAVELRDFVMLEGARERLWADLDTGLKIEDVP